jgi:hypothetical protein
MIDPGKRAARGRGKKISVADASLSQVGTLLNR